MLVVDIVKRKERIAWKTRRGELLRMTLACGFNVGQKLWRQRKVTSHAVEISGSKVMVDCHLQHDHKVSSFRKL
jgi:hypothetical protein